MVFSYRVIDTKYVDTYGKDGVQTSSSLAELDRRLRNQQVPTIGKAICSLFRGSLN